MEENKFKINFSTVLLIIAIVVIIIMGIVIILQNQQKSKYIAEKNNEIIAYNTLNTKYNGLLNKVNNLQNQIDSSNTVDTKIPLNNNQINNNTVNNISSNNQISNNTLNNITQNNNTTTGLSNAEALKIGKEKYEQAMQSFWNDPNIDGTQNIEKNGLEYSKITDKSYINSMKSLYTDNGYLNIFSNFKTIIEANNGEYYIAIAERGSNIYYVKSELVVSNITDSKLEFISKDTYKSENNESITYNENNAFVLIKENGIWKVDKFKLPN